MDNDDSSIPDLETLDSETIPTCDKKSDDFRISCTNNQSLCDIMKVTLAQLSEYADSLCVNSDRSKLMEQFNENFTDSLQRNIVIDGLPWMMNQSHSTSLQKEQHKQMVDEALLAKFGGTVSVVAQKRKFCTEQCCRIFNIKIKHELQNLKKAKVVNDSALPKDFSVPAFRRDKRKFVDFCKKFKTIQENIQETIEKEKKIEEEINFAYDLLKSQEKKFKFK